MPGPLGHGDLQSIVVGIVVVERSHDVVQIRKLEAVRPDFSRNGWLAVVVVRSHTGGAQAIAALAFGTATVPKVDRIVGPGNIYVAAPLLRISPSGTLSLISSQNFGNLAVDTQGNVFGSSGPSVYKITPDGKSTIFAGNGTAGE